MTRNELPARAANIQRAIASTTCNSTTVESLKSFLLTASVPVNQQKKLPSKVSIAKDRAASAPSAKGAGSRARKRPPLTILEVSQEQSNQIGPHEKQILATEVVNATLKALTDAVKKPRAQKTAKPQREPLIRSSSSSSFSHKVDSRNHIPLQPISANRPPTTPSKSNHSPHSSTDTLVNHTLTGLRAQAECARIAFATLRSLQGRKPASSTAIDLQLETGMSVLIAKLIALGFEDLAIKELRILRRRLETLRSSELEKNVDIPSVSGPEDDKLDSGTETLAGMLRFRNTSAKGQLLALITNSQLQILKILAIKRESSVTESAFEHLQLCVPYSPAALIQQKIDPDVPESREKAVLQLESLAQSLIALCPGVSSVEEDRKSNLDNSLPAQVAFQIQLLAFQIRLKWWKIADHRIDVAKEMIEPFTRCMTAFHRRSKLDKGEKYSTEEKAFETITRSAQKIIDLRHQNLLAIYQFLADSAQESSQYHEAVRWLERSIENATECGASQTQLCTLKCRLATAQLRILASNPSDEFSDSLSEAANSLEGNLQGESVELDELLIGAASLRKSAFYIFQSSQRPPKDHKSQPSPLLVDQCAKIVLLCLRFLVRYIGNTSGRRGNEQTALRYVQRRKLAAEVASPMIESVVAMARFSSKMDPEVWEKLEVGLRDCSGLVCSLEDANTNSEQQAKEDIQSSAFISISNAYWFRYLHLKQQAADPVILKRCLRTSIDLIKHRSSDAKVAGFLPAKLEKYGQLCEASREYLKAANAYEEAVSAQIDSGLLRKAADSAATRSIPDLLGNEADLNPLSRVLLAYPKTALKTNESSDSPKSFFDAEWLSASERGVLLEQQYISFTSILIAQGPSPKVSHALRTLVTSLISIYKKKEYPVRRLRVLVRLLNLHAAEPTVVQNDLLDQLLSEEIDDQEGGGIHEDMGLIQFLPHLVASRNVSVNFRKARPDVELIQTTIAAWSMLMQEKPDWNTIQTQVYDIADWLIQLEFVAQYLEMQGLELARMSVLKLIITIHEAATSIQCSTVTLKLSTLGLQYARLGYSGLAGLSLRKAQKYIESSDVPQTIAIRWHLYYAEHAVCNENLKSCENLAKARELFDDHFSTGKAERTRSKDRSEISLLIADAHHVHSLLAAAEGHSSRALFHARLCVKNCHCAWAILERNNQSQNGKIILQGTAESMDNSLSSSASEMSLSEHQPAENTPTPHAILRGPAFWSLVPRIFRGLIHLSHLFAYHGLFPEVRFYLEQSQEIANNVQATSLLGLSSSLLGQYYIRSGETSQGTVLIQQAEQTLSGLPPDRNFASLHQFLAIHYTKLGRPQAAEAAFVAAEKTLQSLMTKSFIGSLTHKQSVAESVNVRFSKLTIQDAKPSRQPQAKQSRSISKSGVDKPILKMAASKPLPEEIPVHEAVTLHRLRGDVLRGQIFATMWEGRLESAASLLKDAASCSSNQQDVVLQALLASQVHFSQGIEKLVGDPVFCVVPESTISCPSISTRRNTTNKRLANKTRPRSLLLADTQIDFFHLAESRMMDVFNLAMSISSTPVLHETTHVLAKILILVSALSSYTSKVPVSAGFIAYVMEADRILSMKRESVVVGVERQLSYRQCHYDWPKMDALENRDGMRVNEDLDFATFQAEYINIIPHSWTVISIMLCESREEIIVSRMRAEQTPFILRLPLNRPSSLDCDEESFGYDQAKTELQTVIDLANETTRGAQDLSRKGAKTEWWEARSALDARLKDLLNNIQSIWLGGFRGIFSQEVYSPDLLPRFQLSLQNILDKYLPSRQKSAKRDQSSRVTLDVRVLELFVGLGNPSDSNDVDEPLMDLLYFIVDILQFNGERNAYDEIDFDSIAIETTDALRQYHQAINDEPGAGSEQHTILILDKDLHCFPWESLSCLNGHSVSRLPSLGCLRDRILRIRRQQEDQGILLPPTRDGFYVPRHSGAYVLNPAGDLTNTQARFEEPLQGLSNWESIVQREPSEAEMKTCVEEHTLFLYFGHGSGGQYIRSRTIKKLEKCAVALLMGCSSGALTEAGEFEPYGTPMNYMHAGSPALLATLWDVTDKDIDRFSETVLEKWGLFGGAHPAIFSSPVKKGPKQKGKAKAQKVEDVTGDPTSLDQAVATARDNCILRYLNGAAPVVYGVPVYLS